MSGSREQGAGSREQGAPAIRSYRDLQVWRQALQLTAECYRLSQAWPKSELYGLTSQMRRAAASIPANIAEGHGLGTRAAYAHHLRIARGSLRELETHLLVAEEVGVAASGTVAQALSLCDEQGRMLHALISRLSSPR